MMCQTSHVTLLSPRELYFTKQDTSLMQLLQKLRWFSGHSDHFIQHLQICF